MEQVSKMLKQVRTMMTKEEFAEEVEKRIQGVDTSKLYDVLSKHVKAGRLKKSDMILYARYGWCLQNPEAVIAYEAARGKLGGWIVNNCSTEISKVNARVKVCEQFGFEASRVEIIGTPYYDSTDWNFIRFNCAGWSWLINNGDIDKVYD